MNIDLSGKRAIVTGSSAGIGLAIAKGLAGSGAEVVINGRTQHAVDSAVVMVQSEMQTAAVSGFAADLGTEKGCADIVAAIPNCDILVNNLGIYSREDFFCASDDTWTRFFETNVLSGVRMARAYLPGMESSGWGRVIFVSSEAGLSIPADQIHYGFSKTAQLSIARGLAKRMAGTGVTVNSILPGPTLTRGVAEMLSVKRSTGEALETAATAYVKVHRSSSIIQRAATVDEVANLVIYACSSQASATTGAALRVDGGVVDSI